MSKADTILVFGADFSEFARSLTDALQTLPPDLSGRLNDIRRQYFSAYGFEGTFNRMNNRTVAKIIEEYEPIDIQPIASGQIDGLHYSLNEPLTSKEPDEESTDTK